MVSLDKWGERARQQNAQRNIRSPRKSFLFQRPRAPSIIDSAAAESIHRKFLFPYPYAFGRETGGGRAGEQGETDDQNLSKGVECTS